MQVDVLESRQLPGGTVYPGTRRGPPDPTRVTADAVVAEARTCIGTPFHHQGRLKGVGLDCVGLLVHVAQALGFPHEDVAAYSRRPRNGELERALGESLDRIAIEDARPGDVLAFRVHRDPQHVAIVTDCGIVHALADLGRVAEHSRGAPWESRIVSAWRFRGLR